MNLYQELLEYGFNIAAVGKEHSCTCVAKSVKLQMTDSVTLQKVVKLLCGRLRIHHIAVLLGKHIVEISPTVAEVGDMTVLLQTVLGERFAEPFRNGDGANTAL